MMDDKTLDSFLESSMQNNLQPSDNAKSSENEIPQRPKLRKIKRAKPRVVPDIPQAPQKENVGQEPSRDAVIDFLSSETLNNNVDVDNNSTLSTDLITATQANEITSDSEYENPYVLEGLPPDLDYNSEKYMQEEELSGYVKKNILVAVSAICLVLGLFIGKTLFSSQKIEKHGLEGVVINEDVPAGRPRCGLTDKSQACVFYLMNWYKQELNGRDFYKLAAQLTGREDYMIETDNLRYATVKIKPGHFAQLNIPALK